MYRIIKTELWKLKRYHIIWAGILLMLLSVGITLFASTALDGTVWTFPHLVERVIQNNTTTIYQAYDTKESTAETPDSSGSKKEPKKKSKIEDTPHDLSVAANTSVLVLDKNGKVLNVVDKFSSLSNLPIDKNNIDVISKGSAQNYFDTIIPSTFIYV